MSENKFIYSKQKILDICKIPHSQFEKLVEIYNLPFDERISKMKVKSRYYTEETLNFIKELKPIVQIVISPLKLSLIIIILRMSMVIIIIFVVNNVIGSIEVNIM